MTSATATPATGIAGVLPSAKQHFLDTLNAEHATTVRVMKQFPDEQLELKPGEKSMTAKKLMWIFVMEQRMALVALTTGFDWSKPMPAPPEPPDSVNGIIEIFESEFGKVVDAVQSMSEASLAETVSFFVAPKTLGNVPKFSFLWLLLCDQIHHRGQLSVYLRVAGARVPSIYGPTADEPWM